MVMSVSPVAERPPEKQLPGNPMHPTSLRNPIKKQVPRTSASAIQPVGPAMLKRKASRDGGALVRTGSPPHMLRSDSLPPSPPSSAPIDDELATAMAIEREEDIADVPDDLSSPGTTDGRLLVDSTTHKLPPLLEALNNPHIKSLIDDKQGSDARPRVSKHISAKIVADALDYHYSRPLPEVDLVFPWLHGLHPTNTGQRIFLNRQHREQIPPSCNIGVLRDFLDEGDDLMLKPPAGVRGLLVVKVGDEENNHGDLVGTVTPGEILCRSQPETDWDEFSFETTVFNDQIADHVEEDHDEEMRDGDDDKNDSDDHEDVPFVGKFLFLDPPDGISLRNFQIQVAKWAILSDIIVYCPDEKEANTAIRIAKLISTAQQNLRNTHPHLPEYHTFVNFDSISTFLAVAPHIVSTPPKSFGYDKDELRLKNWDSNFLFHERVEMSMMSSASPLGNGPDGVEHNTVWVGNTMDFETYVDHYHLMNNGGGRDSQLMTRNWATFVECFEGAQLPSVSILDQYIDEVVGIFTGATKDKELTPLSIQFPSSGSVALSACHEDDFCSILTLCKLLYLRTKVPYRGSPAGALIYCNDGYTETSLLTLAYVIYSTGVRASQAALDLHKKYNRPFFCFAMDIVLLLELEVMLLEYSPAVPNSRFMDHIGSTFTKGELTKVLSAKSSKCEPWFAKVDGCLPNRILPHMYLGSLIHAHNPDMLIKVGIKRVLSVGETLRWVDYDKPVEGSKYIYESPYPEITKVMYMDNIQDDGVDALASSLSTCLAFLDEGYRKSEPTLVHCRVGVSRSATVCIAEVMKRLAVGLPRAYLFVRVRRLNVIIQPNLRFMYELVKWEEMHRNTGDGWLREVDWHILCREIAAMNKVYIG